MNRLAAVALAAAVIAVGFARADDTKDDTKEYPKLLLGEWKITKAGGEAEKGTTLKFEKEGKLSGVIKIQGQEIPIEGTYTLKEDKLTAKFKIKGTDMGGEEKSVIKKLTKDKMELEDVKGGIDELEKVEEKKKDEK